jgi:hypothetical protein
MPKGGLLAPILESIRHPPAATVQASRRRAAIASGALENPCLHVQSQAATPGTGA